MKNVFASFFLLILLSLATGCGDNKSGVVVRVTTSTQGVAPAAKPLRAVTGDLDSDFPDQTLTPRSFTIAFTSFKLFKEDDDATITRTPDYTVFEETPTDPIVVSLTTGQTVEVEENNRNPGQGTYDQIEFGVRYIEMTVPLCSTNDSCIDHRFRFYLSSEPDPELNFTPALGELLISDSVTQDNFSFISESRGLPDSIGDFPVSGGRPPDPYTIQPGTLFPPSGPIKSVITETITPFTVENNPENEFVLTLNFDLSGLFFYDNTDQDTIDPGPEFHFNALIDDEDVSEDGKIFGELCVVETCRADFWPGIPPVDVTVDEEDLKD